MHRIIYYLLISFFIASCGGSGFLSTVEIKITPSSRTMGPRDSARFTGTETTTDLAGLSISTQADAFDWTVEEGTDGGWLEKTRGDTTTYTYTAPNRRGVYHILLRSKKNPTQTAQATLTVN